MSHKIKIAFDLDGVCVALDEILFPILSDLTGESPPYREHSYSLEKTFGTTREVVGTALDIAYARYDEIPIYKGVDELVHILHEKTGEPIYFVTARYRRHATETLMLVNRFCKNVPFIVAFSENEPKSTFLKYHSIFADDRLKTAKELAKEGKMVIMPNKPYNQTETFYSNILRVDSIADLLDYAEELVQK